MSSALERIFVATEEANRLAILAALSNVPDGPMLDIGPHKGEFTQRVAQRVGATDVRGVELIPDHVAEAEARGIAVTLGDVDDGLPYEDDTFTLVLANQVIEHVRRTDLFMTEIRRVLKPGGLVCISTNNLGSWHNVFSLALGYQPMPMHVSDEVIVGNPINPQDGFAHEDLGRTHLRIFTLRSLVELAEFHGLPAVHASTAGYYPLPPRLASKAARIDPRHGAFSVTIFKKPSA
ncbi:MAG: class I SAM-dependent methyltransferase [Solirubrobacteraceae bacterium]|nr:class I SAM-dependent methyltransferase [Solirubrobacteraceae bacterium]